jgi:hypothetical protein
MYDFLTLIERFPEIHVHSVGIYKHFAESKISGFGWSN